MTKWYHIKRGFFAIFITVAPLLVHTYFEAFGIQAILVPVCILAFFTNLATWIDDTKKWNKGTCKLCNSSWVPSESEAYDSTEYHCKCGRTFWC